MTGAKKSHQTMSIFFGMAAGLLIGADTIRDMGRPATEKNGT